VGRIGSFWGRFSSACGPILFCQLSTKKILDCPENANVYRNFKSLFPSIDSVTAINNSAIVTLPTISEIRL
jgi:hypothetical protein